MYCQFNDARLAAINLCVAPIEISIMDELEYYGGNRKKVERLRKTIGIDRRRVCPPGVTAADLCFQAATELLETNDIRRQDIDALLFLSQTPDYHMPATACVLQDRLGLPTTCAALDLSQGCSGYVYGLWMAENLVASGACANVLLLVGDAFPELSPKNRVVTPIFGEGGSASLVVRGKTKTIFELATDGSGHEMIITPAGGARWPISLDREADAILSEDMEDAEGVPWRLSRPYMNGRKVYDFSSRIVPEFLKDFMAKAQVSPKEIKELFPHQANGQITPLVAEKAGFEPKPELWAAFAKYGNMASASIPSAICETLGGTVQDSGLALLCGFGIGLSWGACLLDMAGLKVGKISDYKGAIPENYKEEFLSHWRAVFTGAANGDKA